MNYPFFLLRESIWGRSPFLRHLARERLLEWCGETFDSLLSRLFGFGPMPLDFDQTEPSDEVVAALIRQVPPHEAGMSSVTGTAIGTSFKWNCGNNLTGGNYNPTTNGGSIAKTYNFGTGTANNTSGGGDEVFSFQQSIAAGASATFNLSLMTNLLQQASVNIARIKSYQIRLLSATDDATISPAPNANSTMTVTNINTVAPHPLDFQPAGSGLTVDLTAAAGAVTAVAINVAGSGYPPSITFLAVAQNAAGQGLVFGVTTNSTGVPTNARFITGAGGSGYVTVANVGTCGAGMYTLNNGDVHCSLNLTAGGVPVSSTNGSSFRIYNNDGTNGITPEIDVFGATT